MFNNAKPIWAKGRELEKNLTLGFRGIVDKPAQGNVKLKITASSLYRFFINGEFVGHGPFRGPHGHYRMDEWDIAHLMNAGQNIIAIEVAGYNVNSYYLLDQPSFLIAEVVCDDKIILATSKDDNGFECGIIDYREQKVQRYSFQRPFIEVYSLDNGFDDWHVITDKILPIVEVDEYQDKKIIDRGLPYPLFDKRYAHKIVTKGTVEPSIIPDNYWKDRSLVNIGEALKGYKEDELSVAISDRVQEIKSLFSDDYKGELVSSEYTDQISSNSFSIYDIGQNITGFVGVNIKCSNKSKIYILFDEILTDGDVDFKRLECVNAITYELGCGEYSVESFEPYTMRYLKVIVIDGECEINGLYIREYANQDAKDKQLNSDSQTLNAIYKAGIDTFRQNALDVFMDCPSRERAGWLCDSFFASRVEYHLTGQCKVERNFLENFLLAEKFEFLPEGMLPMCYPADHNDGVFIPNWALWLVLQLEEYYYRSKDDKIIKGFKDKVYGLFEYFKSFVNEYGLLEKLESWVFVEWSKANDLVQDVNFPSNMLYAGALEAAGRLYDDEELVLQAKKIRKTIAQLSFNGEFFVDNAIRENGELKVTDNTTEVCQYYAFFFKIATIDSHKELWDKLINDFGPQRKITNTYPDVYFANAFIGNYLRLDILSQHGLNNKMIEEIEGYFSFMAEKTGTLWEHDDVRASCNHGFASYVVYLLDKAIN